MALQLPFRDADPRSALIRSEDLEPHPRRAVMVDAEFLG
jgi:hypothetical protein